MVYSLLSLGALVLTTYLLTRFSRPSSFVQFGLLGFVYVVAQVIVVGYVMSGIGALADLKAWGLWWYGSPRVGSDDYCPNQAFATKSLVTIPMAASCCCLVGFPKRACISTDSARHGGHNLRLSWVGEFVSGAVRCAEQF